MVMEDRRLPTRQIVDRLGTSQERASNILTIELGSRKVSTHWVARLLNVLSQEQVRTRQTIIWNFLKLIQMTFWHDSLSWTSTGSITPTLKQAKKKTIKTMEAPTLNHPNEGKGDTISNKGHGFHFLRF